MKSCVTQCIKVALLTQQLMAHIFSGINISRKTVQRKLHGWFPWPSSSCRGDVYRAQFSSGPGLGGTILSRDTKISFFPATNSCDRGGQGFPALKTHNLYIMSWVYPEVFFQLDMYKPTHLEGHQEAFCQMPQSSELASFDVKEQWLYSVLLQRKIISSICIQFHFFRHYLYSNFALFFSMTAIFRSLGQRPFLFRLIYTFALNQLLCVKGNPSA